MNTTAAGFACLATLLWALPDTGRAQDVRLSEDRAEHSFSYNGQTLTIRRAQNPNARLPDDFARTARSCPPFCIQPARAAPGVETLAELEVMDFLTEHVSNGTGLLVDARLPEWHARGTLPGAVNLPFTALEPGNAYLSDLMTALGAERTGTAWSYDNAYDLVIFGNGAWSDQAARAVRGLVEAGYPPAKLHYYRAGLQGWLQLGLTTVVPET